MRVDEHGATRAERDVLRLLAQLGGEARSRELRQAADYTIDATRKKAEEKGFIDRRARVSQKIGNDAWIWTLTDLGETIVEAEVEKWQQASDGLSQEGEPA